MRQRFSDYTKERDRLELATAMVENGIDVGAWAQHVKDVVSMYDLTEAQLFNELGGFLGGLRSGLAGLGGVGGAGMGAVGGAIGRGAQAIGRGAQAVGGAVGRGAQAVGRGAQAAGQWAGNKWQQSAQGNKIKQAIGHIDELEQFLIKSQIARQEVISPYLNKLKQILTQMSGNIAGNSSLRFGQRGASIIGKQPANYTQGGGI